MEKRNYPLARAALGTMVAACVATAAACREDSPNPVTPPSPRAVGMILSDPAPLTPVGQASMVPAMVAGASDTAKIVYISLPPDSIPSAVRAVIRHPASGFTVTEVLREGALDPVPVPARVGEEIYLDVYDATDALTTFSTTVPFNLRPRVVRTVPARGKTDVPLNGTVRVVFSEPVSAAVVSSGAIRLFRGSTRITGSMEFVDAEHLVVAFVPSAAFAANTVYRLEIDASIVDVDGESIGQTVSSQFTTGTSVEVSGPVASITVSPNPATVIIGQSVRYSAIAKDANGRLIPDALVSWNSSNLAVAAFDALVAQTLAANALVFAGGDGATTISASSGGITASAALTVLRDPNDTSVGSIQVATATSGKDLDPDGYVAEVDGRQQALPGLSAIVVFTRVRVGLHSLRVSGLSPNCWVNGGNPLIVKVVANSTTEVNLQITCATISGPTSRLAFNTNRDGNYEMYLVNANGADLVRLTSNTADDAHASWSPDGSRITFHSHRDGNAQIYVMNADGTGQLRLTVNGLSDLLPAWSPDGAKIAFIRFTDTPFFSEVFVMNANGTGDINITNNPDFVWFPAWSPDGTQIAFETDRDFDINFTEIAHEIYVMNANGSQPRNITNHDTAEDGHPAWSPDGTRVAFNTNRDGNYEIYVMNANGSGLINLTKHAGNDFSPAWSPDGQKIAFESNRDGNSEIYIMNADGTNVVRVTNNPGVDAFPAWKP